MRRFECDVEPNNCLVFEDAPLGVAAAKTAGIMVPDARLDVSHHKEADQVHSDVGLSWCDVASDVTSHYHQQWKLNYLILDLCSPVYVFLSWISFST
uniref:Uncharacterized protein n=1 Tax=Setaria viridis TaxID=4556 RepID=A0A4U6T0N2_SETVI|nr:hypothetical protein SEVIR_9G220000v2 [Setaria viridis]